MKRFISADPSGIDGGVNLYAYGNLNPLAFVDPSGLTVTVNGDQNAYNQAVSYLRPDPTMSAIINNLNNSDKNYMVQMNSNDDDRYILSSRTIYWDPNSALRTTTGGSQSPALGLGHEMGHADGPQWWHALLISIPSKIYDNWEERRVIQNIETPAAKNLGEDIRADHSGTTFWTPSPVPNNQVYSGSSPKILK